jgi:alpha-tubulin suppressor-like RCC1 family protein
MVCKVVHKPRLEKTNDGTNRGKGDLKTHEFSKLGYEDVAVQVTPRQILSSVTCVDVATSNNHTAVATNDGSLFTFGTLLR